MPTGALKDGDARFNLGMDSESDPLVLQPSSYCWSENMLNRGGVLQARPGFNVRYSLPAGNFQGLSVFTPRTGLPVLVAFVSGVPYASSFPYNGWRLVQGATMSADAKRVYTAQTVQSAQTNSDGSLQLISPRKLLMVQDGINPPAYFDGRVLTSLTGSTSTPQGTHMAWVGSRLWVARREQIFASDIANPLSFVEQTYNTLGGINYFLLSGPCTGLAPVPGAPNVNTPLLAFTDSDTTMFQANILNRSLWPSTAQFQSTIFPTLGCVAPRSIVSVSGMLWWFSDFGLTRLDAAQASQLTTRLYRIDHEMSRSACRLFSDLSRVASAVYENFVLVSVPNSSTKNRHTWVYDGTVAERLSESASVLTSVPPVWASVWTGVNPVEWVSIKVNGRTRLFCGSVDLDGQNRVYEAFGKERRDNGCDFPWAAETRAYTGQTLARKHLRFVEYALSELQGDVNLRISWAGASRGRWKVMAKPTFSAEEGNIDAYVTYKATDVLYGLKKQSRVARTQDVRDLEEDPLSSSGIEGPVETIEPDKEAIDSAFQIRIEGSGPCAIRSIRVFMDLEAEPDSGQPDDLETADHFVRFDGAASEVESALEALPDSYTSTGTGRAQYNNFAATATATLTSTISQDDADKRAAQVAQARAENRLRTIATPYKSKAST